MDFHALPRRDLQALCKRNGVRANMTNAAMADALGALPTVDGVEEYVKQPAAAPEPAAKAAVVEEEVRREKQGSPLPRGRRVTVKASEVIKQGEGKGKEEEKAYEKQDSNKEEDAPAIGVGRRGASRRARPAPLMADPASEPAANAVPEKQGSLPPRARRAKAKSTDRPDDGLQKEELNKEANKEDAPVQGAVRRGPSRRARAAPVAAAPAAEPETKAAAAAEEKPPELVRPDDSVEAEEDMNLEANNNYAPAKGVGRRGPSRRARPAPVVSKPTATAALDEVLLSPPPRGRHTTGSIKSSAPSSPEGGEEDEKEEMQREAVKEIVPALAVGRRGARGRALLEHAVRAPELEVAAQEEAPIPGDRRGKAMVLERIRLNGGEEEDKEKLKPKEKEEDAPAHGVVRRGPSRRARSAPVEAPAMMRNDAAITTEERDVPVEAELVRPSRVRKPTMKAAAAEEKVPRRTTKKATARHSTLQDEKQKDEPQEAVLAPVIDEGRYEPENVEEDAAPQNVEQSKVIDKPKQEDEEALMNENEILMEETQADGHPVTDELLMEESLEEEPPVIDQECMDNLTVEEQQSKDKSPVEEEQVDVDLCATLPCVTDETPVTHEVLMEKSLEEELPVIDQECIGNLSVEEQQSKDKSPVEEQQVDVELCATLPSLEDSPVLGLVSMFAEHTVEMGEDEGAHLREGAGPSEERLDKGMGEENHRADEEIEMNASEELEIVSFIQLLQAPLIVDERALEAGFTGHADHGREMKNSSSVLQGTETTMVVVEDGLFCQDNGDVADDEGEAQPKTVDETSILDCSGNIISAVEEKKTVKTVVSEQEQNEGAISDHVTRVTQIDAKSVGMEKAELVTKDLPHGSAKLDQNGEEDYEHKFVVDGEKAELVNDKLPQSRAKMDEDVEADDFQNEFVHVDEETLVADVEKAQLVTDKLAQGTATVDEDVEEDFQTEQKEITTADSVQEVIMNGNDVVEKVVINKEMQQSTATMYEEDVGDHQLESDFVLTEKQNEVATAEEASKLTLTNSAVDEEEEDVTQEAPESIGTMDVCVQEGYFEIDSVHTDEQERVFTADNVLEVTETEDEDVQKGSVFTGDLPREDRDSSGHTILALLDDITESISTITITEPTVSRNGDVPMCKNSGEKNTAESVCRNKTEKNTDELVHENKIEKNTAQPVAMQENIVVTVAKKSADLKELSLGQLRAKLKKKLERKKSKRVALARVDENACRSNATGQEQVPKLQQ